MSSRRHFHSLIVPAVVIILTAAHSSSAQQLTLTPYEASGIYGVGEMVGWTANLPLGSAPTGDYTYTIRKNNQDVIKTGNLDLATRRATIEVTLVLGQEIKPSMALTSSSPVGGGRQMTAADQPASRTDANSQIAHTQLLEKARKGGIDVYFEGDSITRRWGTSDEQYKDFLANWRQNFFGWNAADFGWGGDTTQNILWRLNNGELDNVKPKIIVILAGTNNVGNRSPEIADTRVANITSGIKAILDICRQKAPDATIVLIGITPRNDNMAVMPIINSVNDNISKFADGKKIRYLNLNDRLGDKDGKLLDGMANRDGLHLNVKGYQVWADALKPI